MAEPAVVTDRSSVQTADGRLVCDAGTGLRQLRSRLRLQPGRTLVGIDGVLGSGRHTFADELAVLLAECGIETVRASFDDHLNPSAIRYARGSASPRGFYEDTYDYGAFNDDVLEPLSREGSGRDRPTAYDHTLNAPTRPLWQIAPENCVAIIDGTFLHSSRFCTDGKDKPWDVSVWLDVPLEEAYRRLHERLGVNPDPHHPDNTGSYQGQQLYLAECDPASKADLVVDNTDRHPAID